MTAMNRLLCLAFIPLLFGGCQSVAPAGSTPSATEVAPQDSPEEATQVLAAGAQLEIIVYLAPELSRTVTISPDGEIRFPYAGLIQTAGRTLEEIEKLLRDALASELRDPDVDVVLSEPAPARCEPCSIAKAAGNR